MALGANVYFDLLRPRHALQGVDPVLNDCRVVCRAKAGRWQGIDSASRSYREAGMLRGWLGSVDYDVSDLDEVAQPGDRLKLTGAVYVGNPAGLMVGRWFVVDRGDAAGWTVKAALQELAGAIESGADVGAGTDVEPGDLILDGVGEGDTLDGRGS